MKASFFARSVLGLLAFASAQSASSATLFQGTVNATSIGAADPTCAPLPFRSMVSGSGTSTAGSFGWSSNACTNGTAGGAVLGTFFMDFGDGTLSGDFTGTATPTGIPFLTNVLLNHSVLQGTGRFGGYTGSFVNNGVIDGTQGLPPRVTFNLSGMLNSPVPEPATWALMLFGFFGIGAMMRRRPAVAGGAFAPV